LVNDQSYNQLWASRLRLRDAAEAAKHEDKFKDLLHCLFFFLMSLYRTSNVFISSRYIVILFKFVCKGTIYLLQNNEKEVKTLFHLLYDYWMIQMLTTYSYDEKMYILAV